jgi:hypothetical protein
LRDFLAGVRKQGRFVLTKKLTEPVTYDEITLPFQKWRKTLGPKTKKYTLHRRANSGGDEPERGNGGLLPQARQPQNPVRRGAQKVNPFSDCVTKRQNGF